MKAKTCVVVSHWVARSTTNLHRLLRQMTRVEAGSPFDLIIVCNGGDENPYTLPPAFDRLCARVLNRENTGLNIGAWEHGWRAAGGYEAYLFLQDECFLKKPGWVSEFEFRMGSDPGIGLLGESIMWDRMSWSYIRTATDRDLGSGWFEGESVHPLDAYQAFLLRRGIDPGPVGTHLQSLIWFTREEILREIGGLPTGVSYREAVACEIALSRLIESRGYRISKVKDRPFELIGHRQWTATDRFKRDTRRRVAFFLKGLGFRRRRRIGETTAT